MPYLLNRNPVLSGQSLYFSSTLAWSTTSADLNSLWTGTAFFDSELFAVSELSDRWIDWTPAFRGFVSGTPGFDIA